MSLFDRMWFSAFRTQTDVPLDDEDPPRPVAPRKKRRVPTWRERKRQPGEIGPEGWADLPDEVAYSVAALAFLLRYKGNRQIPKGFVRTLGRQMARANTEVFREEFLKPAHPEDARMLKEVSAVRMDDVETLPIP